MSIWYSASYLTWILDDYVVFSSPQSAAAALTRDLRVQQALHTMSPHVAHIIKDALGPRLAPTTPHVIPRVEEESDQGAVSRLSQCKYQRDCLQTWSV